MRDKQKILLEGIGRELKNKIHSRRIRVGFVIMYTNAFPAWPLYELMLESKHFEPQLFVIPDAMRTSGDPNAFISEEVAKLPESSNVIRLGADTCTGQILDVFEDLDLVCFSVPYSEMTFDIHSISHLSERGKLVFFINYSFGVSVYDLNWLSRDYIGKLWRVFVPTPFHARRWRQYSKVSRNQIFISGYPKLDSYDFKKRAPWPRIRVILAPHHSVDTPNSEWSLGDFQELAERYAEIPELFPEIDFIFRPHPLLKNKLKEESVWGEDLTEKYFSRMTSLPNVTLNEESDYMTLFRNSDAMIHNSGSFLAEYLYTGKPAAFMVTNSTLLEQSLHAFGIECLKNHYKIYSSDDMVRFISNVVLENDDLKKKKRDRFVKKYYSSGKLSASRRIMNEIEKQLIK